MINPTYEPSCRYYVNERFVRNFSFDDQFFDIKDGEFVDFAFRTYDDAFSECEYSGDFVMDLDMYEHLMDLFESQEAANV